MHNSELVATSEYAHRQKLSNTTKSPSVFHHYQSNKKQFHNYYHTPGEILHDI